MTSFRSVAGAEVVPWKWKEKRGAIPTGAGMSYISCPENGNRKNPHAESACGAAKLGARGSVN